MLSGRQLRGLIVLEAESGKEIGRVLDVVINDFSGRINGLVVSDQGIIQKHFFVPEKSIDQISLAGVIVSEKNIKSRLPKQSNKISDLGWLGYRLLDDHGVDKGTVADIMLENNNLTGWEISSGLIDDLSTRRSFLPWAQAEICDGYLKTRGNNYEEEFV